MKRVNIQTMSKIPMALREKDNPLKKQDVGHKQFIEETQIE